MTPTSKACCSKVAQYMNNMNVIIADDHPIVLFGIRKSLEQIEWVNVVGEFEDSTALINNLPKLDAHVLITDLSMPGDKYGDGITLIKYIKRHFPSLSIIVLTMNNNPAILSAVLDLDIEGRFRSVKRRPPAFCTFLSFVSSNSDVHRFAILYALRAR